LSSCIQKQEAPVPKPKGYFRLTLPQVAYHRCDTILPFSFYYSKSAELMVNKTKKNLYSVNIHYPALSAVIRMIQVPVNNNLHQLMWDEEEQVMFHVDRMMVEDIQYSTVDDSNARVFGKLYELEGKYVATPFKFWLTDSARYFVKGELFFEFAPNNDSLSPVINYLKNDAIYMIESWQWNN
jgi:gliding motility-associated lipoprotein GldD